MAGEAPTLEVQCDIQQFRERFAREGVLQCLNTSVLKMSLFQEKLITLSEACGDISCQDLIRIVDKRGLSAYQTLHLCIKREKGHLGHHYLEAVLENREYVTDERRAESLSLKQKLHRNLSHLETCDIPALLSHMYSKGLLTHEEWVRLDKITTQSVLFEIAQILENKGPCAHLIFAECVYGIDCNTYNLVFEDDRAKMAPKPKVAPAKLRLHGCLKGRKYDAVMKLFQEFHHNGQWETLELEVRKFMTPHTPKELQVVAILERAVSCVFRRKEGEVEVLVSQAKDLCAEIDGHNATILRGRSEYILSRLYRYLQQYDKAHEHIRNAKDLLWMVEPGEDMAFLFYCDACVKLEKLGHQPAERELEQVKMMYEHAIDNARYHESGLDLVEPHSLMRLAQMYLRSSHYCAGSQTDACSISKASNCLGEVDQLCLPLRSQCHYLIIESDLKLCQGDGSHAKSTAESALELAQHNKFTTEIFSAKQRVESL